MLNGKINSIKPYITMEIEKVYRILLAALLLAALAIRFASWLLFADRWTVVDTMLLWAALAPWALLWARDRNARANRKR